MCPAPFTALKCSYTCTYIHVCDMTPEIRVIGSNISVGEGAGKGQKKKEIGKWRGQKGKGCREKKKKQR